MPHTICRPYATYKETLLKSERKFVLFLLPIRKFISIIYVVHIDLDLRWTCVGLFISYDTWGSERDVGFIGFKICACHLLYN